WSVPPAERGPDPECCCHISGTRTSDARPARLCCVHGCRQSQNLRLWERLLQDGKTKQVIGMRMRDINEREFFLRFQPAASRCASLSENCGSISSISFSPEIIVEFT